MPNFANALTNLLAPGAGDLGDALQQRQSERRLGQQLNGPESLYSPMNSMRMQSGLNYDPTVQMHMDSMPFGMGPMERMPFAMAGLERMPWGMPGTGGGLPLGGFGTSPWAMNPPSWQEMGVSPMEDLRRRPSRDNDINITLMPRTRSSTPQVCYVPRPRRHHHRLRPIYLDVDDFGLDEWDDDRYDRRRGHYPWLDDDDEWDFIFPEDDEGEWVRPLRIGRGRGRHRCRSSLRRRRSWSRSPFGDPFDVFGSPRRKKFSERRREYKRPVFAWD